MKTFFIAVFNARSFENKAVAVKAEDTGEAAIKALIMTNPEDYPDEGETYLWAGGVAATFVNVALKAQEFDLFLSDIIEIKY